MDAGAKIIEGLKEAAEGNFARVHIDGKTWEVQKWTCKARLYSGPEPIDCDWPNCGCDPHANRVLEHLSECGFKIVKDEA